jgi:hypothetical protein
LYIDFHTGHAFLYQLKRLEASKEIEIKRVREEWCNLFFYPINRTTNRFYDGLHAKKRIMEWINNAKELRQALDRMVTNPTIERQRAKKH